MKKFFSPATVITIAGALLTVIGGKAYLSNAANLSVPTLFYGFPIFLAGLALKNSELPPAKRVVPPSLFAKLREAGPPELTKLINDVTRWRYGQNVHLESSLKALKLWDENSPPYLKEIEELEINGGFGVRLNFEIRGVSIDRWEDKQERLGRFFAKGLQAKLQFPAEGELDLMIIPKENTDVSRTQNGLS